MIFLEHLISWQGLTAVSGGTAWVFLAWLFITDRIQTTSSARRAEEVAWEYARIERQRADLCDQRLMDTLRIAERSVEVAEKLKPRYFPPPPPAPTPSPAKPGTSVKVTYNPPPKPRTEDSK